MNQKNKIRFLIDWIKKTTLNKTTIEVINKCKGKYTKIMDSYCHWVDEKWVSPNQIVTWRIVAWTTTGAFLASWDYGTMIESAGVWILWLTFLHDAVDGHLARLTNQTSKDGETLDAWWDKVKVFTLIAILLCTMDVNSQIFYPLIWTAWIALLLDIKSQLLRNNNKEALQKCMKSPLPQSERINNSNQKSSGAAVLAWKAKTWVIMSWITLGFMKDIPWFEWTNENAIPLLVSLIISSGLAIKSLKDKWVTLRNFLKVHKNPLK